MPVAFLLEGNALGLNSWGHNLHPSGPCGAARWPGTAQSGERCAASSVCPAHVTLRFCLTHMWFCLYPQSSELYPRSSELYPRSFVSISHLVLMALNQFHIPTFKSLFGGSFSPLCLNIFHHCSICFILLLRNINCEAVVALWFVSHIM